VSALGDEQALAHDLAEVDCHRNAKSLERIRGYLERRGIRVVGSQYIHALEALVKPEPEPVLDAGWPDPEMNR
jgi:hypothetical protein